MLEFGYRGGISILTTTLSVGSSMPHEAGGLEGKGQSQPEVAVIGESEQSTEEPPSSKVGKIAFISISMFPMFSRVWLLAAIVKEKTMVKFCFETWE